MEIVADPVPLKVDKRGMVRIAGTRITLDNAGKVVWQLRQEVRSLEGDQDDWEQHD